MSGLDSTFLDPQAGGDGAMAVTAGQSILAMGDTEKAALGENNKQPSAPLDAAQGCLGPVSSEPNPSSDLTSSRNSGILDLCPETRTVPLAPPADGITPHKGRTTTTAGGVATRQSLQDEAQALIDELNNKRKQDSQMLQDYRKALLEQVDKSCEMVEQSLFSLYESQSSSVQAKIQELFETLDRIGKIENELDHFKQALGILYQDMAH